MISKDLCCCSSFSKSLIVATYSLRGRGIFFLYFLFYDEVK